MTSIILIVNTTWIWIILANAFFLNFSLLLGPQGDPIRVGLHLQTQDTEKTVVMSALGHTNQY